MNRNLLGIITIVVLAFSNNSVIVEAIVDGDSAVNGQFPWTVALYLNSEFLCSGSLISRNTVVTAAHCVVIDNQAQEASNFIGTVGDVNRNSPPSTRILFRSVTIHPNFEPGGLINDVAVFQTTEPVEFSDNVQSVCIARADTPDDQFSNATAMGWGRINTGGQLPDTLMYVEQMVLSIFHCQFKLQLFYLNGYDAAQTQLCTREVQIERNGVCNGDSGGPLVYLSANSPPLQIGIISYSSSVLGCGTRIVPSVSSKISAYVDFIKESAAGDDGICTQ